jgi:hypothetical protein
MMMLLTAVTTPGNAAASTTATVTATVDINDAVTLLCGTNGCQCPLHCTTLPLLQQRLLLLLLLVSTVRVVY